MKKLRVILFWVTLFKTMSLVNEPLKFHWYLLYTKVLSFFAAKHEQKPLTIFQHKLYQDFLSMLKL